MNGDVAERLVHEIYEAIHTPGGWSSLLGAIGSSCGLDGWNLLKCRVDGVQVLAAGGERVSAQAPARYAEHYASIDPRVDRLLHSPPLRLMLTQREFDTRFVANSEFFQDFLLPEGLLYSLGLNAHHEPTAHHYIVGLHRGPERGPFDAASEGLMNQLAVHFQRALRLMDEIDVQRERAQQAISATDVSHMAVFMLDRAANVRDCNRYAEALLRSGRVIRLRDGVLYCTSHRAQSQWATAIDRCAKERAPVSLLLSESEEGATARYSLTLLRSPGFSSDAFPGVSIDAANHFLCLITPLGRRRVASAAQLISTFGLTPAEARLARALVMGQTPDSYAQAQSLKISTVRTHLRALLTKTGAAKLSGLLQSLATLPAVRDEH